MPIKKFLLILLTTVSIYAIDTTNVTLPINIVKSETDSGTTLIQKEIFTKLQEKYFRFKLKTSVVVSPNQKSCVVIGADTLDKKEITEENLDRLIYKNIVEKERKKSKPVLKEGLSYAESKRRLMTIIMFIIIVSPTLIFHYLRIKKYDKKHKKKGKKVK